MARYRLHFELESKVSEQEAGKLLKEMANDHGWPIASGYVETVRDEEELAEWRKGRDEAIANLERWTQEDENTDCARKV